MNPATGFFRTLRRHRAFLGVGLTLVATGELLLRFSGGPAARASLLDVMLIVIPLAGLVLGTVRVHDSREVTELLLAQPVARRRLFVRMYTGIAAPLAIVTVAGLMLPFAWHGLLRGPDGGLVAVLAVTAALLVAIASALAFVVGLRIQDRVRALGVAFGIWFVAALLWDGIVLLLTVLFANRPVEAPLLAALALNPLDLARVLLLLGTDGAAMLGTTGAVLQDTLGTTAGRLALGAALTLWLVGPLWAAARTFTNKDF